MWGNILTEVSFQSNFNIGFSNNRSDVLIHLTQWQYWWWFWFTFLWVLYYLIIAKTIRFRVLKFRPRIATSFRSRGKWGDLLVCLIPISWCINILINSNFLLKLIEWQNESSLFTLRIRGRQWYWVYKFDLKNITDIISAPKNIGRNRWVMNFFNELETSDNYLHILQLRSQNKWIKEYSNEVFNKNTKIKKFNLMSPQEKYKFSLEQTYSFIENKEYLDNLYGLFYKDNTNLNINDLTLNKELLDNNYKFFNPNSNQQEYYYLNIKNKKKFWNTKKPYKIDTDTFNTDSLKKNEFFLKRKTQGKIKSQLWTKLDLLEKFEIFNKKNFSDYSEFSRFWKRSSGKNSPLKIIKYPLDIDYNNDRCLDLLKFRFNEENSNFNNKNVSNSTFLTFKQKRYKRKSKILDHILYYKNDIGANTKKIKYSGKLFLKNNSIFLDNSIIDIDNIKNYRMFKKNKKKFDLTPVAYSKRLLRTQRTLVLPAHVNITAITNSYDVVHSWFIPGLGLKLDCIPGRATHHTFFIDNVGFYYGQCAEICGRYHHHMPIRVCALPFEHFLVWWNSFGLPKLLFTNVDNKKCSHEYSFRKYSW
uniref:cytochrome c oxidase subunit 2 n=1 Tax=Cryptocaryon irritans TaxID=153251 RepID=UPI0022FD6C84|nr:cytochrome c oxidase subunit 2 [Cryptocaryon irritans]WBP62333.1 cytochrome c oxidase subunit 2 [Cryptocaryon irritans]